MFGAPIVHVLRPEIYHPATSMLDFKRTRLPLRFAASVWTNCAPRAVKKAILLLHKKKAHGTTTDIKRNPVRNP
ncbi:hypothetical protein BM1_09823 [Bipolaris maydis]|nr:hypothetical protein BM1_09823 [Bipolaris maydis]